MQTKGIFLERAASPASHLEQERTANLSNLTCKGTLPNSLSDLFLSSLNTSLVLYQDSPRVPRLITGGF